MITRRKLLVGALGMAGLAALGFAGGRLGIEAEIAAGIRQRLGFLKLDEAGVHAFAVDQVNTLLAKRPTLNRLKYHFLSTVAPSFTRYERATVKRSRLEQMMDTFASTYLLSTDFFSRGADESRVVKYVAYYDPMLACGNPFARPATGDRAAAA